MNSASPLLLFHTEIGGHICAEDLRTDRSDRVVQSTSAYSTAPYVLNRPESALGRLSVRYV